MAKAEDQLKKKVAQAFADMSGQLTDAAETWEEPEAENGVRKYYPTLYIDLEQFGDQLAGINLNDEIKIVGVATVKSISQNEDGKNCCLEISKMGFVREVPEKKEEE